MSDHPTHFTSEQEARVRAIVGEQSSIVVSDDVGLQIIGSVSPAIIADCVRIVAQAGVQRSAKTTPSGPVSRE